jgi:hypothetical protein
MSRFVSSDIVKDGVNYYAYASSNPLNVVDRNGFWNADVHVESTMQWVNSINALHPSSLNINGVSAAQIIADANKGVDWDINTNALPLSSAAIPHGLTVLEGFGNLSSPPVAGGIGSPIVNPALAAVNAVQSMATMGQGLAGIANVATNSDTAIQQFHFNIATDGSDIRQTIANDKLGLAIAAWNGGDQEGALQLLGQGLHALQDMDAHGNAVGIGSWWFESHLRILTDNFDNKMYDWADPSMTSVRPTNKVTLSCGTEVYAMLRYRRTQLTTLLYLHRFTDATLRNCET